MKSNNDEMQMSKKLVNNRARPQTTCKKIDRNMIGKTASPGLVDVNSYETDCFTIEKLKRIFTQDQKSCEYIYNENVINSLKSGIKSCEHKISYKRGVNVQRIYYKNLAQKLSQLQKTTSSIERLNAAEIFEYKQKYINNFLFQFFKQIGSECYQKEVFVGRLWQTIKGVFEQIIKRLIKQVNKSQKLHLTQSYTIHEKYQKRFKQFMEEIECKDKEVDKYKQIISKIAMKSKKKTRKNKQITHGIVEIAGRLSLIEKQRNQLKSQYINMLTLGYEGGMQYKDAKKFTISKFGIQNSTILSQTEEQNESQANCLQIPENAQDNMLKFKKQKSMQGKSKKRRQSNMVDNRLNSPNVVFKLKQKYVYGPTRLTIPDDEQSSNQQINLTSFLNIKKKEETKQFQFLEGTQRNIDSEKEVKLLNGKINRKTQTTYSSLTSGGDKECVGTNLGVLEMYRDNLIKNKQCQTQCPRKAPTYMQYSASTQYDILDTNFTESIMKVSLTCNAVEMSPIKVIDEDEEYKKLNINITNDEIKENLMDKRVQQNLRLSQDQQMRFENNKIKKKDKGRKNDGQSLKKKGSRPSIFKRSSIMGPNNHMSFLQQNREKGPKMENHVQPLNSQQKNIIKNKPKMKISNNSNIRISDCKSEVNNKNISNTNNKSEQSIIESEESQNCDWGSEIVEVDAEDDYYPTDMLSVMQNMSKLSPKGIYIDETMYFLLKKSLFRIKHDNCDNVYKKNLKLISKIRQSVSMMKNIKVQNLLSIKSVIKMLTNVYDLAFQQLQKKDGTEKLNKNRRESNNYKKTTKQVYQINLLQLLRDGIQKEYPMNKPNQIEHKMVLLAKSMETEGNYFFKNFMLLSCLDDSIFSSVIFSSDVEFYLHLLLELTIKEPSSKTGENKSNFRASHQYEASKENRFIEDNINQEQNKSEKNIKNSKIISFNGAYENCYTHISKLKESLFHFLKQFYKKQSLFTYLEKRIFEVLQNISRAKGSYSKNQIDTIRLDVFKCCQLIMESIFSFKLDILKSFAQVAEIPDISPSGLINEEVFIDIIGFLPLTKLQKLNTINKFRYDYGKQNTIAGVNIINLVNFCLNHGLADFDQILYDVIRKYRVTDCISKKIDRIHEKYRKYNRIQKICTYLHKKNLIFQKKYNPLEEQLLNSQLAKQDNKQILPHVIFQTKNQNQAQGEPVSIKNINSIGASHKNICLEEKWLKQIKHKEFWEIIGVNASKSLIHCKVVQLESSQLLETILGPTITDIYMLTLCRLQQKKYQRTTISPRNSNLQRN